MSPLSRLRSLFRGQPRSTSDGLQAYGQLIKPLAQQLDALYSRWRQDLEVVSTDEELANAASIQRWEAAGLLDRLRLIQPPLALGRVHAELGAILADTARASQLLSNSYRFTSSRARCDGQSLMLDSEARFRAVCPALARSDISVVSDAHGDAVASV